MRRLFVRHSADQITFDWDEPRQADAEHEVMARILVLPAHDVRALWPVLGSRPKPGRRANKPASALPRCGVMVSGAGDRLLLPDMPEWVGLPHGLADDGVASLSDIVVTCDVPAKFFLSPKACAGMVRRAAKRGRALPPHLLPAIEAVAAHATR